MPQPDRSQADFTVSRDLRDDDWDAFLSAHSAGQFQQSSRWARVKASESWECARLLVRHSAPLQLLGGAQLLFRPSRLGRIGYISKGPVLAAGAEGLLPALLDEVRSLGRSLGLKAWILQPPDDAAWQEPVLSRSGYLPARVMKVIDATLVLDLERPWDELLGNVRKSTIRKVRRAEREGVLVREGTEKDVAAFFDLMVQTSRRQKTKPNPSSASVLLELWRAFYPAGGVRLTLAEREGVPLAGLLALVFGRRATLWKKGWDPATGHLHPNEALHLEAIRWAWERRYQCCDFVALDRGIAEAMLAGRPLDEKQEHSRHMFNIVLGAAPKLLAPALVYFAGRGARALYRAAGRVPGLTALLRKVTMGVGQG